MASSEEELDEEQMIEFVIRASLQESCSFPLQRTWSLETASEENLKILAAIEKGDVSAIRTLHCHKSAFTERDSRGWLPMHRASVQPDAQLLDAVLLASHELSMEEATSDGETSLTLAAQAGHVKNVKMLLRHGSSPHNTNSKNESPLLLAVRLGSYDMVLELILGGAFVEQVCLKKWTALHEAAQVGCTDVLMLLLRHGGKVSARDGHGVTPLGVAAEFGRPDILEILIEHGGDVSAQATNGDTVLYDASGSGNLDCILLLLNHGASPNVASLAFQLPVHRAAYEGHYLALKTLMPITTKRAIRLSGMSPVHSAADGGQAACLELLIEKGYDVNALLGGHISDNYGDMRKSPLYFAVSNGDVTCAEMLLSAGAEPDLDPLRCLLVAVRAGRYELVRLLLAHGADVNCFFTAISDTVFPTALQYCLQDHMMLRLLLNNGYSAESCFRCRHDHDVLENCVWERGYMVENTRNAYTNKVTFCEFVSVSWLKHLVGRVVRTLLDYVRHVNICSKLQNILEKQKEWPEICEILNSPRSLQHLCRLLIRTKMTPTRLNSPEIMSSVPFPPALKNYLIYKEYDLYGRMDEW
ncbi:ankyrin repeat and SOCS box protein 15b isoform X1 [Astyanax mexicanus]|uniref:ankyrin repeat and SOCS box protein 15b isoform X1 n=2 Tax=Astyanax mexicanus TaxID=7994 RepID=UPI0020CB5867|nr:ankyrin repeat and SOCS box protein 15b isoform X1 [Astyanax mexicanus]